jgi:hypothetical protein
VEKADVRDSFVRSGSVRLRIAVIVLSFLLIFGMDFAVWRGSNGASAGSGEQRGVGVPRAVILDGLYGSSPNEVFLDNVSRCLTRAGFRVDVFRGENVTVDLLRGLGGYGVVVLRVHSAINLDGRLYVFSGEPFSSSKYWFDVVSGTVKKAEDFEGNFYFAISIELLGSSVKDGLKGSSIVLMGCNGTDDSLGVKKLFERGVRVFFGWNGFVNLSHSDLATSVLMRALYVEGLGPMDADREAMSAVGPDPSYETVLQCRIPS